MFYIFLCISVRSTHSHVCFFHPSLMSWKDRRLVYLNHPPCTCTRFSHFFVGLSSHSPLSSFLATLWILLNFLCSLAPHVFLFTLSVSLFGFSTWPFVNPLPLLCDPLLDKLWILHWFCSGVLCPNPHSREVITGNQNINCKVPDLFLLVYLSGNVKEGIVLTLPMLWVTKGNKLNLLLEVKVKCLVILTLYPLCYRKTYHRSLCVRDCYLFQFPEIHWFFLDSF